MFIHCNFEQGVGCSFKIIIALFNSRTQSLVVASGATYVETTTKISKQQRNNKVQQLVSSFAVITCQSMYNVTNQESSMILPLS